MFYDLTKSKLRSGEYDILIKDVNNGIKTLPQVTIGGRRRLTKRKPYYKKSKKSKKSKKNKKSKKRR